MTLAFPSLDCHILSHIPGLQELGVVTFKFRHLLRLQFCVIDNATGCTTPPRAAAVTTATAATAATTTAGTASATTTVTTARLCGRLSL